MITKKVTEPGVVDFITIRLTIPAKEEDMAEEQCAHTRVGYKPKKQGDGWVAQWVCDSCGARFMMYSGFEKLADEVIHLRDQRTRLQQRCTELLMENRKLRGVGDG